MRLTDQQRTIVNPYPETFTASTIPGESVGGRSGDYDYTLERNKWVIDGIQDSYINYRVFPKAGDVLERFGPLTDGNNIITIADIMAYAALYPQNAIVIKSTSALDKGDEEYNPGPDPLVLKRISDDEGMQQLVNIFNLLAQQNQITKFSSLTTVASQKEEYASLENSRITTAGLENTGVLGERTREAYAQQLISFPAVGVDDNLRLEQIRKSFKQKLAPTAPTLYSLTNFRTQLVGQNPPIIDLLKWQNNVSPTSPGNHTYYNRVDEHVYYVVRTSSRDVAAYDENRLDNGDALSNISGFKSSATRAILKFCGISTSFGNSPALLEQVIYKTTYGDSYRSTPPPGYGVWLLMAKIPVNTLLNFAEIVDVTPYVDADSPSYVTPLSSYQLSRSLISKSAPTNSLVAEVGDLKSLIRESVFVLRYYEDLLTEEELGPDLLTGLKLENQITQFEGLLTALESLYGGVGVSLDDKDSIEIKMDGQMRVVYYGVNGNFYFKGLGYLKDSIEFPSISFADNNEEEPDVPDWLPTDINYLENFSPTALGFLFYSYQIASLFPRLTSGQMPPWTEFLSSYVYPNPNENSWWPAALSSPTKKNKNTPKKSLTKKQIDGHGRGSRRVFKKSEAVQRVLQRRTQTGKKVALKIKGAVAGCDVPLAPYLRTGANAYLLLARKGNWKEWVALSIAELRNHLKDTKKLDLMIKDFERYSNFPSELEKEVNQYVNGQLDQCLTQIGELVVANIIDPAGNPKNMKTYWRKSNPSKLAKVNLRRPSTLNLLSPWWKGVQKLLKSYINQVIASVIMDVLKASLGCGPQPKSDLPQTEKAPNSYGVIQINEILNEDIDPIEIAISCGLQNVVPTQTENGDLTVALSPPTLAQMEQYHQDVSDFLTSEEMLALLDGNAADNTVFAIEEMVNKGPVDVSGLPEELRENKLYVAQLQDSLRKDDVRYAALGITTDNIIEYFSILGELINPNDIDMPALDVKAALCARRNPTSEGLLNLGLSEAQLIKQVDEELNTTLQKIKEKCDLFNARDFDVFGDVRSFFDSIPAPAAYERFLAQTSAQSRRAQKAIFGETASASSTSIETIDEEDTALFKMSQDEYGFSKTMPHIQEFPEEQGSVWTVNVDLKADPESDLGSVYFKLGEEKVDFFYYYKDIESGDWKSIYMFSSPLAENNLENAQWSAQYFPNNEIVPFTLRGLSTDNGLSTDPEIYPSLPGNFVGTINQLITAGNALAEDHRSATKSFKLSQFMNMISNTSADKGLITDQIKEFYLTPEGIRNLKKLSDVLASPFFISSGDPCAPTREERIATAMLSVIQNYLINFFLNVGPVLGVYRQWNTPDITNVLSHHLATKMLDEASVAGLTNIYADALDMMSDTFGTSPDGYNINFDMKQLTEPIDQLAYTIQRCLKVIYFRGKNNRFLSHLHKNIYSEHITDLEMQREVDTARNFTEPKEEFIKLIDWFQVGQYASGEGTRRVQRTEPNSLNRDNELIPLISERGGGPDGFLRKIQYYVPVPLVMALQVIYYDKVINLGEKFPAFRFYFQQRIAVSQDGLLSAVNGYNSSVFSTPFDGYPVTIRGITYYSQLEILERIRVLKKQRQRIYELENIFGPVAVFEDEYVSLAYATSIDEQGTPQYLSRSLEEFRDYFNPRYTAAMSRYRELYDTEDKRQEVYRTALKYRYSSTYPEEFEDGVVSNSNIQAPKWMRERSWYERARLLGAAPEGNNSLIKLYERGYDVESTDRFIIQGINIAEKSPPVTQGQSEAYGVTLLKSRLWMLNANSYDPNPALFDSLKEWWNESGYWSHVGWFALNTGLIATALVGISFVIAGMAGAAAGALLSLVAWPATAVAAIIAFMIFTWDMFADEDIDFADPNTNDALKYIRTDGVILPPNPVEANDPVSRVPVDIVDDFIEAVPWYNTTLTDNNGNPIHGNTLDKIAMNWLYYELTWKSHYYKPRVEPTNEGNEINELRDYLDLEYEEPGLFPLYLALESDKWFLPVDAPLPRRVFFSPQQLQDVLTSLRGHPLMSREVEIFNALDGIKENGIAIRNAVARAEAKMATRTGRGLMDDVLDRLRCALGTGNAPHIGTFQTPDESVTCPRIAAETLVGYVDDQINDYSTDAGWIYMDPNIGAVDHLADALEESTPTRFNLGDNSSTARRISWTRELSEIANLSAGSWLDSRPLSLDPNYSFWDDMNGDRAPNDPYRFQRDPNVTSVITYIGRLKAAYRQLSNNFEEKYWGPDSKEVDGTRLKSYTEAVEKVQSDISMLADLLDEL